ncbi:tripartite tricarboxylate transporter substrate binding protein [Aquincola sp. J276]|uniref:Bug family tripartite tricarboxylate transporter substrate binding protein n=1 Tax=Aquincola sp. J276 TaxID=2898432 RepID=UPI0021518FC0|nr:tripartite tricarboxylate transporter substrate binding protein [Aquincola sp. J276]MCR5868555.1 tripartite tricarboxylate transporter substrate binding protein [Aquincola sp. J276]
MTHPSLAAGPRRLIARVMCGALAGLLALAVLPARAQAAGAWPQRPITLVVPFPPGGSADVVGRLIGKHLGERLGQPVVIDNRAGAGTILGASLVAKAPADGYTLLISSGSTFTVNPALRPNLPYDPVKSFDPLGIVARIPLILLANKSVPVNDVKGFVQAIKARPEQYAYASFGSGTTSQFTAEIVLHAVGAKLLHVPYKGSAPAMTDLIGGQVPFSVDTVTAALPQLKAGKVKAIAVTTARRASQLPDVPTFAEAGYPEVDADTWIMLVAPKGTPAPVRATLERTLAEILATPQAREALLAQGAEPRFAGAAESVAQIDKELPLMRAVARRANIQPD